MWWSLGFVVYPCIPLLSLFFYIVLHQAHNKFKLLKESINHQIRNKNTWCNFGQLRDFCRRGGGVDILWFWRYFGDFRSIFAILVTPKGYFCHFRGFRVLVVLEILRLFWSIKRFQRFFFWTFCNFWGILVILVI